MGITEILRRIWLFSANKIKSSESFSKQPTQLIVELNSSLQLIIVTESISVLPITELSNQLPPTLTDFFLNLEVHVFNYDLTRKLFNWQTFRTWFNNSTNFDEFFRNTTGFLKMNFTKKLALHRGASVFARFSMTYSA